MLKFIWENKHKIEYYQAYSFNVIERMDRHKRLLYLEGLSLSEIILDIKVYKCESMETIQSRKNIKRKNAETKKNNKKENRKEIYKEMIASKSAEVIVPLS